MEARRLLPYIAGLFVLAFALGSLPRSALGGNILFRSYWLLYLIYLGPIVILGMFAALILLIGLNWRGLSEGIGAGLAGRMRKRKARSRRGFIVTALFWALAIVVLFARGCTPVCNTGTNSTIRAQIVGVNATATNLIPAGEVVPILSDLVGTNWFSFAFLGLIVVSGLVIIQSMRVAFRERDVESLEMFQGSMKESLEAVKEALKLVDDPKMDPRSRIIACFQHLISTASRMGAPMSVDQTARELEKGIRTTFGLKGQSISDLTGLFEEARYSLHLITDDDSQRAYQYLESIAGELNVRMTALP